MKFKHLLLLIFLFIIVENVTYSQIVTEGYVEKIDASYPKNVQSDPGFIYFGDAILKAQHADEDPWDFTWVKITLEGREVVSNEDSIVIQAHETDNISNLYQLIETDGTDTISSRAWVFIPYGGKAVISFLKDEYDTLLVGINCDVSKFNFTSNLKFSYNWIDTNRYNVDLSTVEVPIDSTSYLDMIWTSTPSESYTYKLSLYEGAVKLNKPIYDYTSFFVRYKQTATNYKRDTLHIIPRATKAILDVQLVNYDDEWDGFWTDTIGLNQDISYRENYMWDYQSGSSTYLFTQSAGPAPLWVQFKVDESLNASKYYLAFGDSVGIIDTVFYNSDKVVYHLYTKPSKEYSIYLRTWNKYNQCVNTSEPTVIEVKQSNMTTDTEVGEFDFMPNLFISGYGQHFSVRTQDVSIKYAEIKIYDRNGTKIHQFKGDIKEWPGWDGTLGLGNKEAPEGVYFYSIEVTDWTGKTVKGGKKDTPYTGFFHLYHE